jgi:hypothetical protein
VVANETPERLTASKPAVASKPAEAAKPVAIQNERDRDEGEIGNMMTLHFQRKRFQNGLKDLR